MVPRPDYIPIVAAVLLSGCAADLHWASDRDIDRALHKTGEPPSITLITVVDNRRGTGAHSALLVDASHRAVFDPAGTFTHWNAPERNDVHFGITDAILDTYIDYHARTSYDVVVQKAVVSPQIAEFTMREIQAYGAVPKVQCALSVSRILRRVPGFGEVETTWYPMRLSGDFGRRTGAIPTRITDDDPDDNSALLSPS